MLVHLPYSGSLLLILVVSTFALHASPWAGSREHGGYLSHRHSQSLRSDATTSSSHRFWYEVIAHNGEASFMDPSQKSNYKVFRNVVADFNADNTGQSDASAAIQKAIDTGASNGPGRNTKKLGTTSQPAVVYIPSGTYLLRNSLQLYLGTVVVGDPINPPVLKVASGFSPDFVVRAKDPNYGGTDNFFVGFKNIVIDSTDVHPDQTLTLLDWTVSQATQLTNVFFNMPNDSTGHVGLSTLSDSNSNLILNDLRFHGGRVGVELAGQQWVFKNMTFSGTATGVLARGFDLVFLGCHWENGHFGINAESVTGSLTVIDSSGTNLVSLLKSPDSSTSGSPIILENIRNDGTTVTLADKKALIGDVFDTWIHGDLVSVGAKCTIKIVPTKRSPSLLGDEGRYFTMRPPTYEEYPVDFFVNVKEVPEYPVHGDGVTDDTVSINAILAENAGCKVVYFPAGTYIVTGTVFVPAGSRIVGDAFASVISALGPNFKNENVPVTMVQVGNPGDVGVAQFSDMMFTVADILEGCKLVEINIAGYNHGDVGLWNTHFRIGGSKGSKVRTECGGSPSSCKAAWALLHLTATSSTYIENMWGWTADHDLELDGHVKQNISTARGALIEARGGTWLVGTGFEHHTLYQYNFYKASNIFAALQQSETPYWQGVGSPDLAPAPWTSALIESDPSFQNCYPDDSTCRMAWFEQIQESSNLFLYGGGVWTFFNANGNCRGWCQKNAIRVANAKDVYLYGTNTHNIANMILEGPVVVAPADRHAGGWGGVIAGMFLG
ncbi:hypothetical protein MPDQ_005230 [Monascus purpureus]|uniref:Rhamnogalacturonase A/B/Epimerase-like pectate lyase domain-containing protein n=1 Tax=Monascus purpureus TaxID=5098 RepID=A0A507R087_MONPU|nr:hypothetical protein MPDQ_005230 [Monascus purpureus]